MTSVDVQHMTDPACPFAFSNEPVRWQLKWCFGEQLRWRHTMIVLTREEGEPQKLAEGAPGLQRTYGMPIDPRPYPRTASCEDACRAVIAARLRAPEHEEPLLRALRVRVMDRGLIDDPALLAAAAADVGWTLPPLDAEDITTALEEDARQARSPVRAARAQDHRLGGPPQERRYSAGSYVYGDGVAVPGCNTFEAHSITLANLDPTLRRRPWSQDVTEVLEWAGTPLATVEVVALLDGDEQQVRAALAREARAIPTGADAYWTLD